MSLLQDYLHSYKKFTAHFYSNKGNDFQELLGWSSRESQFKRFEILLVMAQSSLDLQAGDSIIDIGCGYAALLEYIQYTKIQYQYTGIDSNDEYINIAKKRYPNASFTVLDILNKDIHVLERQYDVAFLSGLWNLDIGIYYKSMEEKLIAKYIIINFCLSILCRSVRKGVVCNFLHEKSEKKYEIFNYHFPEKLIDYLHSKGFSVKASKEGYLENDFTLAILPKK